MTEFLFFIALYYPIARAKLRQSVTNLRTAQNWKQVKTPAIATLCAFFPVRTKNLQNKLRGLPENPMFSKLSEPNPVSGETPSPYGRVCPCRGHISPVEGDPRSPFQPSINPEVTHEQS
ncbi:hypothetical protein [Pseudochrobactrum sp. HB0163]|uniref:hypothetical protein n=1 Tax=Pseudochrobactrum sp. HB0163 TaxID=3450708 RepID=UPI003F6DF06A